MRQFRAALQLPGWLWQQYNHAVDRLSVRGGRVLMTLLALLAGVIWLAVIMQEVTSQW
jgi:hypothetical protein